MKSIGFTIDDILAKKEHTRNHVCWNKEMSSPRQQYGESMCEYRHNYHRYLPYHPTHAHLHHGFPFHRRSASPPQSPISPDSAFLMMNDDPNDLEKLSRRPRTSITVCQREFLEKEFQKERYPTLAYIDKLSRKVHLQQYVIKVWFQNRRAKYRKEGHRRQRQQNTSLTRHDKTNGIVESADDDISVNKSDENSDDIHLDSLQKYDCNQNVVNDYNDTFSTTTHTSIHNNIGTSKRQMFMSSDRHCSMLYPWHRVSNNDTSLGKNKCRCLMCRNPTLSVIDY